jgi:hypothetical protein
VSSGPPRPSITPFRQALSDAVGGRQDEIAQAAREAARLMF